MICFPNAKINLGLNIVSKREDGYHNLETVFYPIGIKDALEIIPLADGKDSFSESGIKVDSPPDNNLVIKALKLMRESYDIPPIEVHLLKKIPFGAGIGGGSADASFMLSLLNKTFRLNIPDSELAFMARKLGADCPFFIYNRPLFAKGIGELFEDVELSLQGYHFVLIKPDIHISTKEAFALIKPKQPEVSLKEIVLKPINQWKTLMRNDFEDSIFPQFPEIERIKNKLYELGAVYASMSGSGSSVYGIFGQPADLEGNFKDCYIWQG
ncbi:4-diphosphocytidyl-2-C-methyl-D-erythritol kinase [Dysgonomonas sp. PH5-45]|uniref:4-(cytidine 5'-diphospho)-2-C-methyl-D-erythritol kinase n=1 Tax=unclassified Dysgonomonas TaxID=2630389 RepID=UPI002473881F|nr:MULTISPECIES: 4-(cytidine 5'-diphospho)-2-C-methyl-D-erythritol kinase [unclassified Dysgonomonas]MDH6354774.1 4-diphosphocytidyl-2-C-methyl-D-erythritol kinase [Dysgonomonas sp. PH5-45]MDH6387673.1 4-diphosphocytidyl-2-C-methyl-D-erythritol kinase [Dysgonomonas sp. PH5-37]